MSNFRKYVGWRMRATGSMDKGDYRRITAADDLGEAVGDPAKGVLFIPNQSEIDSRFKSLRVTERTDGQRR